MRWIAGGLALALFVLGWKYHMASEELAVTKMSLAVAVEANETNKAAIARLERSIENTDKVLAGWNEDRTTLAGVRSATRQAIKEAMRDETFKAWGAAPAPDDAFRLLGEAVDADGNGSSGSAVRATGELPGNADTGKRQ